MEIKVRQLFHEKNPGVAKMIPGFVFSYLEHVIHQNEVNAYLKEHGDKQGIEFVEAALKYFNISTTVTGIEKIPQEGRYLFASNHPLGGFDGIILMKIISDQFGSVKVMVNDLLMNIPNLAPLFLPINKHGSQNKDAVIEIENTFNSDISMLTFPAGLCSRKIKGEIADLEWKKNFITKAMDSKRDIIPIYFDGRNSRFFYNLANIRKKLGIKANIEMLYLADELFKHRNGKFTITFGKPVSYKTFDKSHSQRDWAALLRTHVYELKYNKEAEFKPN